MMELVSTGMDMAAIILTVLIIVRMLPGITIGERTMPATLFLFAMVSLLFAYIYWFTYTLMRPDARMPFAANEVGEMAAFLLLSATLEAVFRDKKRSAIKEVLFTAAFSAASIALWIAWTGEWFQDIVGGLAFGYLLCTCAKCMKQTNAVHAAEWLILGVLLTVLIMGQVWSLFLTGTSRSVVDLLCYGIMFTVLIYFLVKNIRRAVCGADARENLALSCGAFAFCLSTMFMSEGWFYVAAMLGSLATLPLMAIAVKREAET